MKVHRNKILPLSFSWIPLRLEQTRGRAQARLFRLPIFSKRQVIQC